MEVQTIEDLDRHQFDFPGCALANHAFSGICISLDRHPLILPLPDQVVPTRFLFTPHPPSLCIQNR
jgi:hypothetical protein